jgi:hypothetical protein
VFVQFAQDALRVYSDWMRDIEVHPVVLCFVSHVRLDSSTTVAGSQRRPYRQVFKYAPVTMPRKATVSE